MEDREKKVDGILNDVLALVGEISAEGRAELKILRTFIETHRYEIDEFLALDAIRSTLSVLAVGTLPVTTSELFTHYAEEILAFGIMSAAVGYRRGREYVEMPDVFKEAANGT